MLSLFAPAPRERWRKRLRNAPADGAKNEKSNSITRHGAEKHLLQIEGILPSASDPKAPLRRSPSGRPLAAVLSGVACAAAALVAATGPTAAAADRRISAASLEAARRFLCPQGGAPRPGRKGICQPLARGAVGGGGDATGWDAGIRVPSGVQMPCPLGSRPARARDRPESVRCLPE